MDCFGELQKGSSHLKEGNKNRSILFYTSRAFSFGFLRLYPLLSLQIMFDVLHRFLVALRSNYYTPHHVKERCFLSSYQTPLCYQIIKGRGPTSFSSIARGVRDGAARFNGSQQANIFYNKYMYISRI